MLEYLNNDSTRFQTFVASRIHGLSAKNQGDYVNTSANTGDVAFGGVGTVECLNNSIWFHGPHFFMGE